MDKKELNEKRAELAKKIDSFVEELKRSFLATSYSPTGVWDKVKNWWNNLRFGADNPQNKYFNKNRFGSLGVDPEQEQKDATPAPKSECIKFSLKEFRILKENHDELFESINEIKKGLNEDESESLKNLKLFRIIDDWAKKFKSELVDFVYPPLGSSIANSSVTVGPSEPPSREAPQKEKKPAEQKAAKKIKPEVKPENEEDAEIDSEEDVKKALEKLRQQNPEIDIDNLDVGF